MLSEDWQKLINDVQYHSTTFSRLQYATQWKLYKLKMIVFDSINSQDWKHMKIYSKILYVPIGAIFNGLMKISIPPTSDETWDRRFASVFPFFALAFLVVVRGMYTDYLFLAIGFPIATTLCLIIYCTTHRHIPPKTILVLYDGDTDSE